MQRVCPMICSICKKEAQELTEQEKDGSSRMVCRECLAREQAGEPCRCKETIGKSTSDILKMVVKDMVGRKKSTPAS